MDFYKELLIQFVENWRNHGFIAAVYADFITMFFFFLLVFCLIFNIFWFILETDARPFSRGLLMNERWFEPREKYVKKGFIGYLQKRCFYIKDSLEVITGKKICELYSSCGIIFGAAAFFTSLFFWNFLPYSIDKGIDYYKWMHLWYSFYILFTQFIAKALFAKSVVFMGMLDKADKSNFKIINLFLSYVYKYYFLELFIRILINFMIVLLPLLNIILFFGTVFVLESIYIFFIVFFLIVYLQINLGKEHFLKIVNISFKLTVVLECFVLFLPLFINFYEYFFKLF